MEHAAGDLVVTVQAGVRLGGLAKVLSVAGQRLALDLAGDEESGTVGGLIATGAAGPLRYRYGAPRDLLIGITVVRADGTITKSGGKVVKNVAGYDLGKLFAGSFGTLGLITEATFRLHPAPATTTWITRQYPDPQAAAAAIQIIADSPLAPAAIELLWESAAGPISVSALLEGDADSVSARSSRLEELLGRPAQAATQATPALQAIRSTEGSRAAELRSSRFVWLDRCPALASPARYCECPSGLGSLFRCWSPSGLRPVGMGSIRSLAGRRRPGCSTCASAGEAGAGWFR